MKTIGEVLKLSASYLQERKVEHSRRSAEEILAHLLQLKRMDLYLQFDRPLDEGELTVLREMLKRKVKGEPVEYITGELEFYNCKIKVDARVLIPRQASEILVDHVVKRLKGKRGVLWDICTGSGCLGIAIKKALPELQVTLADLSKEALALARENGQGNGVEVEFLEGDLFGPFGQRKADFIVANPPYVSQSEYLDLDPSVRDFEPKLALLGGERGTEFYERMERELPSFLNPGGWVFFEIGAWQGEALKKIFSGGNWKQRELLADWAGRDRFFFLEKQ
ncbi:MAG TPA: peptide chain release factor N(5)-glutamine methyltransferase [Chlamydiales bacterium]|nr:peptide chain release factor N(5)-glutamine methyltransferase [Chlamydiales bacterium]